jgi:hypothetical protein
MKYLKTQFKLYTIVITAVAMFVITSCNSAKNDSKQPTQSENQEQSMEQNNMANTETEANLSEEVDEQEIAAPAQQTTEQAGPEQNNAEVMLNPPHGEPYHRCDIPVGAPLNSPPANPARQTTTAAPRTQNSAPATANNPTAPTIENAMRMNPSQSRSTTPANSGTKPRLNPAHGQPWHRCDIPVGSPLP